MSSHVEYHASPFPHFVFDQATWNTIVERLGPATNVYTPADARRGVATYVYSCPCTLVGDTGMWAARFKQHFDNFAEYVRNPYRSLPVVIDHLPVVIDRPWVDPDLGLSHTERHLRGLPPRFSRSELEMVKERMQNRPEGMEPWQEAMLDFLIDLRP